MSNIANISPSQGSVTPLEQLSDVLPCGAGLWAPATLPRLPSCSLSRRGGLQVASNTVQAGCQIRSSLQKRALFQKLLQFDTAISCWLSARSSPPAPLLTEPVAFPSPRGGISWCSLASKLFTLKHPCRNGKKQRSR